MRFVLTWGHGQPPDLNLDSYVDIYNEDSKNVCLLFPDALDYYCDERYGSLVHQTNVSSIE